MAQQSHEIETQFTTNIAKVTSTTNWLPPSGCVPLVINLNLNHWFCLMKIYSMLPSKIVTYVVFIAMYGMVQHNVQLLFIALYRSILHCSVGHCIVRIAICSKIFHYSPLYCKILHSIALDCTSFFCVALHCSVLHLIVLCCTLLRCISLLCTIALHFTALHFIAWCC